MALTKVPSNLDAAVSVTQSQSDNSTNVATTEYVDLAISNLSDSAPAALNTLNEIAAALGDDANYASTTTAAIAGKLPLAGGTLTGALAINSGTANTGLTITSTDSASWLTMTDPTASLFFGNTAGNYALYTGGTESMKVDTTGKLSIGGATPQGNLTIKGASSDDIDLLTFSEDGTNQSFSFNGNFAGTGSTGNELTLDSYWTNDIMVWGGDGNVGINQNSPQAKLDIKGDTTTYAGMSKIYLTDTSSSSERRNWAIGNGGSGYGHFSVGVSNAADGDPMASGTHTTPFVIDHEGRVSIGGYASPGHLYAGASQLVVGKGVGDQGITIYAGSSDLSRLHFADGTSGNAEYAGFIAYDHDNEFLQIGAGADGGTDIILNNNAVGIGTSTTVASSGAKLEVKGTYANTAPATSGTTDSMVLRLSQNSGNGVLDTGWGDQGSNPHFWLQSRNSGALNTNYAIGLNPNGGNVFIGQKFTNKIGRAHV